MTDMQDASTLSDAQRVRRTELAAAHTDALRIEDEGDRKAAVAKVEKAIQEEYTSESKAATEAAKGGK